MHSFHANGDAWAVIGLWCVISVAVVFYLIRPFKPRKGNRK